MFRKSNLRTILVTILLSLTFIVTVNSQTAASFLLICPSAEGTAMGNSGVAMVFEDAYGQWFNPAQLGISSQENNVTFSFTLPVRWQLQSEMSYNPFGISAGYDFSKEFGIPLSFGAGYIRQFMDLGEFTRTDEHGQVIGKFKSNESADAFTVAAGLDYWVKIGFGVTYKHIFSKLTRVDESELLTESWNGTANAMDVGLLISAPVLNNLIIFNETKLNVNVNAGYSISNLFDDMKYPREVAALPRTARLGYSISANVHHEYKDTDFELIGLDWSAQAEDMLARYDTTGKFDYDPIFKNINPWDNLILLKSGSGVSANYGIRISLAETFKYMKGWMTLNTQSDYNTSGYEISSSGILKFLGALTGNSTLNYIASHFELAYVYAGYKWNNTENNSFNRIYDGLNLKFKNFNL